MVVLFVFIQMTPFQNPYVTRNEAHAARLKVLLIPREGYSWDDFMIKEEAMVMKTMLEEAGFKVIVATLSGETIESTQYKLKTDKKLSDVNIDDYAGIIMPCMGQGGVGWHARPDEIEIVRKAVAQNILIAAQLGSIITLAEAGALKGKKYTFYVEPSLADKGFDEGIYSGTGVLQDGNIITSSFSPLTAKLYGVEDGTAELTKLFIETIKEQSQ
jgi:putative intracellular protease/amidase